MGMGTDSCLRPANAGYFSFRVCRSPLTSAQAADRESEGGASALGVRMLKLV